MRARSPILHGALACLLVVGTAAPAAAVPVFSPKAPAVSSDLIEVQNRRNDRRRDRFERRGNQAYWRGHRGYRDRRPGYRRYNGWWFPPAAFALGAIIGGAINQPAYRGGSRHVQWCYDRYRSYRASDNSWQPYNGPRRQCRSPYG